MRIISGTYKSRKIFSAENAGDKHPDSSHRNLRPTTDRARESLFNILNNIVDFDGLKCLDLFAGTGSVGFELLSRGADHVDFVDLSGSQIRLIEKTAESLGCSSKINLFRKDAAIFLSEQKGSEYDLVFADPPYDFDENEKWLGLMKFLSYSVFVMEYSSIWKFDFHPAGYEVKERKIGITNFRIFISEEQD